MSSFDASSIYLKLWMQDLLLIKCFYIYFHSNKGFKYIYRHIQVYFKKLTADFVLLDLP